VLVGEKRIPGVPRLAGVAPDETDVEASLEQFDLALRLVVEVIALPGPGVAGRRLFRGDDDAAEVAIDLCADGVAFVGRRLVRLDAEVRFVHEEVIAVEPMPARLLVAELRGRGGGRRRP
jgi:hypothetical protein